MRLIGLTGFAGVGKTTLADAMLSDVTGARVSFATPLRHLLSLLDPLLVVTGTDEIDRLSSFQAHYTYEELKRDTDLRDFLVRLGAGARQTLHPDVWVDAAKRMILAMDDSDAVVIDDVRYENEAKAIYEMGGVVLLVQRDGVGAANLEEERSISALLHRPGVSGIVRNDGDLDDLIRQAQGFMTATGKSLRLVR